MTAGALPVAAARALGQAAFEQQAALLFGRLGLGATGLSWEVFREGLLGYYNVRAASARASAPTVLTLVDFSRPSQQKRLWVIDVRAARLLFHTLVAHGKASGGDRPVAFSNQEGSEMSSLGFYRTARATYVGKHGESLKLIGLDPGFNTNAESRAVVLHGAPYVCEEFVKAHGRLGRSQGCPALPVDVAPAIVRAIKGGSVLYLHGPAEAGYHSRWLSLDAATAALGATGGGGADN
ncbi:MAG: murein L,D-transpeptidase catalytic domain family protein [Bacteroidota bacterium]|nr:murein L,D-transpeptidase catalytic domain family protein [Bacteroidota bacterium]